MIAYISSKAPSKSLWATHKCNTVTEQRVYSLVQCCYRAQGLLTSAMLLQSTGFTHRCNAASRCRRYSEAQHCFRVQLCYRAQHVLTRTTLLQSTWCTHKRNCNRALSVLTSCTTLLQRAGCTHKHNAVTKQLCPRAQDVLTHPAQVQGEKCIYNQKFGYWVRGVFITKLWLQGQSCICNKSEVTDESCIYNKRLVTGWKLYL